MRLYSSAVINKVATKYFVNQKYRKKNKHVRLSYRDYSDLFACEPHEIKYIWRKLDAYAEENPFKRVDGLLLTLFYYKKYPTWDDFAKRTGRDQNTLRKMTDMVTTIIASNVDWIKLSNRFYADNGSICKQCIDGIDAETKEVRPMDPKLMSHKFKHAGLRYLVATNIQTGDLTYVDGPYAAGEWPDLRAARNRFCYDMTAEGLEGERTLADGGFNDGYEFFETPTGHNDEDQRMKSLVRARHEQINSRFKDYAIICQRFRARDPFKHAEYFYAVANIIQLKIHRNGLYAESEKATKMWQVDYYDVYPEEGMEEVVSP
ncbi:hypothetical protein SEMRO_302_G112310.1 [Seminavis robusta]|uniref:DDE Tnp4 domain-containing protein n=1 Tax=Seminavis robusta TaxID=568900 RepID=A0A9N8HAN2_9STRA|nr:hypothetical protein SEMRO_302_G112310.1 [Seminavis robusta]|eukprot:Sro302_g112310.1 n/a (318) ;mRNA; r:69817-70849